MIIFPSILEKTSEEVFRQVQKLSKYYSHFQIDIADGLFVPSSTLKIEEFLSKIQNTRLPTSLTFEFHLMVKDFESNIKKLLKLKKFMNIKTILIHASLSPNHSLLTTTYPEFSFGLVLNPEDSVETIKTNYDLQKVPLIQIMSVNPGAQGNPFIPGTLQKVEQLRNANYKNIISLDGAINETTLPFILSQKFQPDILCPGSYLTRVDNLEEHVKYLKEKATA